MLFFKHLFVTHPAVGVQVVFVFLQFFMQVSAQINSTFLCRFSAQITESNVIFSDTFNFNLFVTQLPFFSQPVEVYSLMYYFNFMERILLVCFDLRLILLMNLMFTL